MHAFTRTAVTLALTVGLAAAAQAQFTGPSREGDRMTVATIQDVSFGTYVTVEGNIVAHLRSDYFTFRDASGEIMVEIPSERFGGQQVGPETRVRLMGEVDRRAAGQRYIWVKSLTLM